MRRAHRVGRTVVLRLRFDDFTRATRSHTLAHATDHTDVVLGAARMLWRSVAPTIASAASPSIGLSVANLADERPVQLELPFDPHHTGGLDRAVDAVRDRFGTASISRATLLGHDPGLTVPMLPD